MERVMELNWVNRFPAVRSEVLAPKPFAQRSPPKGGRLEGRVLSAPRGTRRFGGALPRGPSMRLLSDPCGRRFVALERDVEETTSARKRS